MAEWFSAKQLGGSASGGKAPVIAMACIYILYSGTADKFYTGSSRADNTETRVAAHNSGKTQSTKSGRPWKMVYKEELSDYTEARKREIFLKSGIGRKLILGKFRKDGRVV